MLARSYDLTMSQLDQPTTSDPAAHSGTASIVLRWIAMPFASVLGSMLAGILVNVFFYIGDLIHFGNIEGSCFFHYVDRTLSSGLSGYVFTLIAYKVAPSCKYTAAVVMTTILGVACTALLVMAWVVEGIETAERFDASLGSIAAVVGGIISASELRSDTRSHG
jgi:hypothetical protein